MGTNTRNKILDKAYKLFAEKSFDGVSIRELAKECDVNVAAINYHFDNKRNLYIQTLVKCMLQTTAEMETIYNFLEEKSTLAIAKKMYAHFIEKPEDLRTTFKIFMASDKESTKEVQSICHTDYIGPPGGEFLKKCILNDAPNASEEDMMWLIDTIFIQVMHRAIWSCNHSPEDYGFPKDQFEKDTLRMVKVLLESLK